MLRISARRRRRFLQRRKDAQEHGGDRNRLGCTPGGLGIMDTNTRRPLSRLSDRELLAEVKRLVRCEREATCRLVAHLSELDQRRLYLAEGCSSLFTYCTQVLRLSEHAAYGRIEAARAARRFPVILELLARGAVNLTAVGLLAPL